MLLNIIFITLFNFFLNIIYIMNFKAALSKFLTNKLVLNIVSLLALFNVIGYMVMGYFNIVVLFIVIAILVRYFSKNMIVVLGIPLILINLLSLRKNISFEGFEDKDASKNANTDATTDKHKETIDKINKKANDAKSNLGIQSPLEHTNDNSDTVDNSESFEAGRRKNRNTNSKIDYASTIEEAYDNLNSILGSDGINRLTQDSQRLMKQQADLAESMKAMGPLMKTMEPMLNQAKQMMEGFNDSKSGLGNIMGIAEKLKDQLGTMNTPK